MIPDLEMDPRPAVRPSWPTRRRHAKGVCVGIGLSLALSACTLLPVPGQATVHGRVASVPLPAHSQITVRVCEQATPDCDRWIYPEDGRYRVTDLDPGSYTVSAYLEEPGGLIFLTSADATLAGGQAVTVDLNVPAIPSSPPA